MPAKSDSQRKLMAAGRACKRGTGKCTGKAAKVAQSMSDATLTEFMHKPKKTKK